MENRQGSAALHSRALKGETILACGFALARMGRVRAPGKRSMSFFDGLRRGFREGWPGQDSADAKRSDFDGPGELAECKEIIAGLRREN